ncbi:hypothetical protein [Cupriavidus sp. UME77]|uniref:hypothetical protein n=1 Tax=Cupriavidus sp. UME77 TaxID=1862321 RepID=UPI00160193EC|nr:hypothetical protein [Cupriavidus sp. UME77]
MVMDIFRLIIILSSIVLLINSARAGGDGRIVIGNRVGEVQLSEGPSEFMIEQRDCRYALNLGVGWHVKFNDPDVIFYFSKKRLKNNSIPYLSQAEMQSGYDWSFKSPGGNHGGWFGVMCERRENFTWDESGRESSEQLAKIREANSQKCPARLNDGKWVRPRFSQSMVAFRELRGADWIGFVMAFNDNVKTTTSLSVIRFCIVHNEDVIVGAMESAPQPLTVNPLFFGRVIEVLSTIRFFPKED